MRDSATVVEPETGLSTSAGDLSWVRRGGVWRGAPVGVIKGDRERGNGAVPGRQPAVECVPRRREAHHSMGTRLPHRAEQQQEAVYVTVYV